jgi:hypothetical protein
MPLGPGKYDDLATLVRKQAAADGVIVIVLGGPAGPGFSVQGDAETTRKLPTLLRVVAHEIEQSLASGVADE